MLASAQRGLGLGVVEDVGNHLPVDRRFTDSAAHFVKHTFVSLRRRVRPVREATESFIGLSFWTPFLLGALVGSILVVVLTSVVLVIAVHT